MENKEAYDKLTLEMLDEYLKELADHRDKQIQFVTGKQGVLGFMRTYLGPFMNEEKLDVRLTEIGSQLREGLYHYDGMEFIYQGKLEEKTDG